MASCGLGRLGSPALAVSRGMRQRCVKVECRKVEAGGVQTVRCVGWESPQIEVYGFKNCLAHLQTSAAAAAAIKLLCGQWIEVWGCG